MSNSPAWRSVWSRSRCRFRRSQQYRTSTVLADREVHSKDTVTSSEVTLRTRWTWIVFAVFSVSDLSQLSLSGTSGDEPRLNLNPRQTVWDRNKRLKAGPMKTSLLKNSVFIVDFIKAIKTQSSRFSWLSLWMFPGAPPSGQTVCLFPSPHVCLLFKTWL